MATEYNIIIVLLVHFFADFIFQSRTMAKNKSKSIYWLTMHVLTYTAATVLGWELFLGLFKIPIDVIFKVLELTFVTHLLTDFVTSKASGYCYIKMIDKENKSDFWEFAFWTVIGLDQFIHGLTLILTYKFFIA
jgi:hypothetical protein